MNWNLDVREGAKSFSFIWHTLEVSWQECHAKLAHSSSPLHDDEERKKKQKKKESLAIKSGHFPSKHPV